MKITLLEMKNTVQSCIFGFQALVFRGLKRVICSTPKKSLQARKCGMNRMMMRSPLGTSCCMFFITFQRCQGFFCSKHVCFFNNFGRMFMSSDPFQSWIIVGLPARKVGDEYIRLKNMSTDNFWVKCDQLEPDVNSSW